MSRTLHDLVLGELQQLTTKSQRDDRFDTYMKKTYNKTASLMANSCQAVAQMASTASNTGLALSNCTYDFGLEYRVSVQGVKSLGGHFACLCRGFEFYEVNFYFFCYYFSKRKWKYF